MLLGWDDINLNALDKHGQKPHWAVAEALVERPWRLEREQISTLNEGYQTFVENHHEKLSDRRKRNLEDQRKLAATKAFLLTQQRILLISLGDTVNQSAACTESSGRPNPFCRASRRFLRKPLTNSPCMLIYWDTRVGP